MYVQLENDKEDEKKRDKRENVHSLGCTDKNSAQRGNLYPLQQQRKNIGEVYSFQED